MSSSRQKKNKRNELVKDTVCNAACPHRNGEIMRCIVVGRQRQGGEVLIEVQWERADARLNSLLRKSELTILGRKSTVKPEFELPADHHDAHHARLVDYVVMDGHRMPVWYWAPLPEVYHGAKALHFCPFCLSFFRYQWELERHAQRCELYHPPGDEIYRRKEHNLTISVFEVDGARARVYCQNLAYLSKMFLEGKTLWWDVDIFIFYIVTEVTPAGCKFLSYFSKEKFSTRHFNLSCIMAPPCYQRMGLGTFMMSLSYELSLIEQKPGTPERPFSDLGERSYRRFWSRRLIRLLLDCANGHRLNAPVDPNGRRAVSIHDIVTQTCFLQNDIIETLRDIGVLIKEAGTGRWRFQVSSRLLEDDFKLRDISPHQKYVSEAQRDCLRWSPYLVSDKFVRAAWAADAKYSGGKAGG